MHVQVNVQWLKKITIIIWRLSWYELRVYEVGCYRVKVLVRVGRRCYCTLYSHFNGTRGVSKMTSWYILAHVGAKYLVSYPHNVRVYVYENVVLLGGGGGKGFEYLTFTGFSTHSTAQSSPPNQRCICSWRQPIVCSNPFGGGYQPVNMVRAALFLTNSK